MNENKISFAEKYPILNTVLGLVSLIVICAFAIWLINVAVEWVVKLSTVISTLDTVIVVTLITGLVSIVTVFISSIGSKIVEYRKSRQEYLTQKREKPYGDFVEMIYRILQNAKNPGSYSDNQMLEDLSKFSKQITLWGSTKVVNKWIQFRENGSNPEKAKDNLFLMEEIMNDMRKDLGVKKVKTGNLLGFFVNDIKSAIKNK